MENETNITIILGNKNNISNANRLFTICRNEFNDYCYSARPAETQQKQLHVFTRSSALWQMLLWILHLTWSHFSSEMFCLGSLIADSCHWCCWWSWKGPFSVCLQRISVGVHREWRMVAPIFSPISLHPSLWTTFSWASRCCTWVQLLQDAVKLFRSQ